MTMYGAALASVLATAKEAVVPSVESVEIDGTLFLANIRPAPGLIVRLSPKDPTKMPELRTLTVYSSQVRPADYPATLPFVADIESFVVTAGPSSDSDPYVYWGNIADPNQFVDALVRDSEAAGWLQQRDDNLKEAVGLRIITLRRENLIRQIRLTEFGPGNMVTAQSRRNCSKPDRGFCPS